MATTTPSKAGSFSSSLHWIRRVQSRLAEHLQSGPTNSTTDLGGRQTAVQSSRAGDLYFQSARDDVARAAPRLILPSCLLPPGHLVTDHLLLPTHRGDGANRHPKTRPIFVYRDPQSGTVHACVNQCRHRGAQLVPTTSCTTSAAAADTTTVPNVHRWNGSALTCPYHSWTYDIRSGSLRKIPGQETGFPCMLEKGSLGLLSLPCREVAGGIWVGGEESTLSSKEGDEDVWSLREIDGELKDLWLDPAQDSSRSSSSSRLVGFREWKLNANWQLLVETFLEAYHVPFLHRRTLGLVTHGNCMVVDRLDARSLRHTVPLLNFEASPSSTVPSPTDPFFSQTTTTYFAFPAVSISLFKRFAAFMSIVPDDGGGGSSNSSQVRLWAVTHAGCNDDDLDKARRDLESVLVGLQEDWDCAQGIQHGLTPDTILHHGRFEGNNIEFLQHVGQVSQLLRRRDESKQTEQ